MKKLVAIWKKDSYKACPVCASLQGIYDTETKELRCYMCKTKIIFPKTKNATN